MAALSGDVLSPEQLAAVADLWTRGGREIVVRLTGRSMEPAIPSGAEVRIRCGESGDVGDIVACQEGAGVRVHRLVARSPRGWLLTRGDARWVPDAPLPAESLVLGRVVAVRRGEAFEPPPPLRAVPAAAGFALAIGGRVARAPARRGRAGRRPGPRAKAGAARADAPPPGPLGGC